MVAAVRDPRVRKSPSYQGRRIERRPQHKFSLRIRPYQIQPFMIAPVLPGETMVNLLLQARVVTDPLSPVTKLVGWHQENYFFYVKHRDLEDAAAAQAAAMVLDPSESMTVGVDADGLNWTYCYPGAVDWTLLCVKRIVEEYFRDEGEAWDASGTTLDGVPLAAIYGKGTMDWTERLTLAANKRTDAELDLIDGSGELQPMDFINKMSHWQSLRDAGLTEMDYQDFVNTYGAETREAETSPNLHRPELIRYTRNWQYPTNIVEPTTGVPATAVAWSVAERADKQFRFNEPGFVVGLMCCRPKVYLGKQQGAIVGAMDSVYDWLPAVLQHNYEAAYHEFTDTTGPLAAVMTQNYWVDIRDIFLGGDQFINYAVPASGVATAAGVVQLPTVANQRRYALEADIDELWKDDAVAEKIQVDGVAHLAIKGMQTKTVPGTTI